MAVKVGVLYKGNYHKYGNFTELTHSVLYKGR